MHVKAESGCQLKPQAVRRRTPRFCRCFPSFLLKLILRQNMNRLPIRTAIYLFRTVHVLLVNKVLDYLVSLFHRFIRSRHWLQCSVQILAFYFLFIKMIKHISNNYRRRRIHYGHRGLGCDYDLVADESSIYGPSPAT